MGAAAQKSAAMSGKRELAFGGVRCSDNEDRFLRDCAALLDMDSAQLTRKSLAIALPLLLGNRFIRRVELQDIMEELGKSVKIALVERNAKDKHK